MSIPIHHRPQFVQRIRRVRARLRGTAVRPRLAIFCGGRTTAAQLIDDVAGRTLASASDQREAKRGTVASAAAVGMALAAAAKRANISTAVLDRRGHRYHGRIRALADAVRNAGLVI